MKKKLMVMPALLLVLVLFFAGCDLNTISGNNPANTSETSPHALTLGSWFNGNLAVEGDKIWFSFPVSIGTTYRIYQNDNYNGDGSKTCDISVSGKYQGDSSYTFGYSTFGVEPEKPGSTPTYDTTPQVLNATKSGTFLLLVQEALLPSSKTGTFAIKVETPVFRSSESNPIPLTESADNSGDWHEDELEAIDEKIWYSFSVNSGTRYNVYWDDAYLGSGLETADIRVAAKYQGDATFTIFSATDTAYSSPRYFMASKNGTVLLMVERHPAALSSSDPTGTFAIAYTTGATARPSITPGE